MPLLGASGGAGLGHKSDKVKGVDPMKVDGGTDHVLAQSVATFIQIQTDMLAAQTKAMRVYPHCSILVEKWGMRALIGGSNT